MKKKLPSHNVKNTPKFMIFKIMFKCETNKKIPYLFARKTSEKTKNKYKNYY